MAMEKAVKYLGLKKFVHAIFIYWSCKPYKKTLWQDW